MQTGGQQIWTSVPPSLYHQGKDIWTEHRNEAWRYDLLDLNDKLIGSLDGVESSGFDFSVHQTIRSSGSITWAQPTADAEPPDWTQVRIQPWYMLKSTYGDRTLAEHPLGVFLPSFPTRSLTSTGVRINVALHDKLLILDQDKVREAFTAPSGAMVTTVVRQILHDAGQVKLSMDESTELVRTSMTWDAGTSRLRIVNDLLEAAGYFSLDVDGHGIYQAHKYVPPVQRGVSRAFIDNASSIYDTDMEHDNDIFSVPNTVIAVSTSDGETEAMVAVAEDRSSGPFSIPSRGRVIAETEEGVEATSQNVLNQYAARRLNEMQQVTSSYDINHALVPTDLNSLVQLVNKRHKLEVYAVVQSFSVSSEVGALQNTRIREVVQ